MPHFHTFTLSHVTTCVRQLDPHNHPFLEEMSKGLVVAPKDQIIVNTLARLLAMSVAGWCKASAPTLVRALEC